jgi:hypothetical protein
MSPALEDTNLLDNLRNATDAIEKLNNFAKTNTLESDLDDQLNVESRVSQ